MLNLVSLEQHNSGNILNRKPPIQHDREIGLHEMGGKYYMKMKLILPWLVVLSVYFQNSNVLQAQQVILEPRDHEVLEVFCVRFLADRLADPTLRSATNRNALILVS